MLARRFSNWSFALAFLVAIAGSLPARAGDCAGMSHYEYDGGECVDKAGDTSGAMSQMWNDSYRNEQFMNHANRPGSRSSAATGGARVEMQRPSAEQLHALAASLFASQTTPSDEIDRFVGRLHVRDRHERAKTRAFLLGALRDFDSFGPQNGYGRRSLIGARAFFVRSAYYVYDGDRVAGPAAAKVLQSVVGGAMALHSQVPTFSDVDKRRLFDRYVLSAIGLLVAKGADEQKHDIKALAATRAAARRLLANDIGVDPARARVDELACVARPMPGMSCQDIVRWYQSPG
ncbi:MAG: hypothetical protein NVS3B17_12950 [Vulcanimicrobiaceae bacterium]